MSIAYICAAIAVMAVTTYLCRVITMILFRKKMNNRFVQSFLFYMPYAVLSCMVFPAIIFSTGSIVSGSIGAAVALILSFFKRSLLTVSVCAIITVYVTELILVAAMG